MTVDTPVLDPAALHSFHALRSEAIESVARRFYADRAQDYAQFGDRGREACREDLGFHLDFLRPVLEFGLVQPMVDYLRWLSTVLIARDIPAAHLSLSLEWLAEFFEQRMDPPANARVAAALRLARSRFDEAGPAGPALHQWMPEPWPECAAFESALLAGDRRGAAALLQNALGSGRSLVDAELHMIQPALYSIGQKWQNNQVTVAQEHLATAISQAVMTQGLMQATLAPPQGNGRKVLLACVEGNQHAVGLQMVADAFQLAGWEVQYLGGNVPTAALLQQVRQFKPDLLGLSLSFPHHLKVVKDVMARLSQLPETDRPPVMIGGLAINQFSSLAGELGADGWSPDAKAAVTSAAQLGARYCHK